MLKYLYMTNQKEIYRCNICGNIVEVVHNGAGQLVCCGEAMEKLIEKEIDEGKEKHVPVIEKTEKGILVKVGEVAHPMEDGHYIEWIEANDCKVFLKPGDEPSASFNISGDVLVRIYCNIHGLWKSKI
jgi:superoxide reductase